MGVSRRIQRNVEADKVLLNEAFEDFMMEKEARNLSPATLANYRVSYEVFLNFFGFDGNEVTTDEITVSHFYKWINTMRLNGTKPTTINHYLRDTRTFFYWCMDDSRAYITPPFKIQMISAQEEQLKLFSDEDIDKLLVKPRVRDSFSEWRSWAIVNWVLATGNRAATICDVRIGDINFNRKEIALRHTKNKKAQIIPLSPSLETVIKEYIRMWRNGVDKEAYLFCNIGEEKLTTGGLRQAFVRYCKNREVSNTNIHGLRHNFAKGWVQNNGNMFALQKILGHSSLDMTRKYVKLFAEDIKDDFEKFNPLDNIKRSARRTQAVKRNGY